MLELSMTKKGWNDDNIRSRSKSRERVSLLGDSNANDKSRFASSPASGSGSGLFGIRGRESKRRTRTKGDQEMFSLLGPSPGKTKRNDFYRQNRGGKRKSWTKSRIMKYVALLLFSALVSFKLLRKESKMIHWEEYNNILEPKGPRETRCFEESRDIIDQRCSCPDSNKAMVNKEAKQWKSNHDHMVSQAKNAPEDLDIVFFGDGMIEQLSGTRELGREMVEGMEEYFDSTFRKNNGGKFNAIALGSSGDTGPNLLWHWENGIQQANLRPKLWFIMVGGNDLYVNKCTDRFVKANVLNLAKRIFEDHPDAKIVIHGIIPRKDDLDSKSNKLGHLWNRAQGVNLDVLRFIKTHSTRISYMNLGQTLMIDGNIKGRRAVDPKLIKGKYPTPEGMKKWGDLAVKKLAPIVHGFDMKEHRQKKKKPDN